MGNLMVRWCRVLLPLAWVGAAPAQSPPWTPPLYTWSVVPQFTALDIHRDWSPVLRHLEHVLPVRFELALAKSIPKFEQSVLAGEPDFAYLNPYHMVKAHAAQGYVPMVRDGARMLRGILVVKADDEVHSVADLQGAVIAFPSPNAFAASLYMRALLHDTEGLSFVARYVGTHSNVYRHALLGKAAAGGGVEATLSREPPGVRDALRVIFRTPATAAHPVAAHPRVPPSLRRQVADAIVGLAGSAEGRRLLQAVLLPRPQVADYERDYAPVAALDLDRFAVPAPR